jgi:hypothetical protein
MRMPEVFKAALRPMIPTSVRIKRRDDEFRRRDDERRTRLKSVKGSVAKAMDAISSLTDAQCVDAAFLERDFIPSLGLNDELLMFMPPEWSAPWN